MIQKKRKKKVQDNKTAYQKLVDTNTKIAPKICSDFIKEYLRPLTDFEDYLLNGVIAGISVLPKKIVNFMRGRALYLTDGQGPSMTIQTASNLPKIDYLGLIPGIFLERQGLDDHFIHARLIHEIGHLIHKTVISRHVYDSQLQLSSLILQPDFPEMASLEKNLEQLFEGNQKVYDEKSELDTFQQILPQELGFITYYSLKNTDEDFAEHFLYFILHNKYFQSKITSHYLKSIMTGVKDSKLGEKYEFMKNIIGEDGISIDKDLLDWNKYKLI